MMNGREELYGVRQEILIEIEAANKRAVERSKARLVNGVPTIDIVGTPIKEPKEARNTPENLFSTVIRLLFSYQSIRRFSPKIELPPGHRAKKVLSFLYTKKAFERVFADQFADMEIEYFEALKSGDARLARWVKVRGYLMLFATVVDHAMTNTVYRVFRSIIGSPPGGA